MPILIVGDDPPGEDLLGSYTGLKVVVGLVILVGGTVLGWVTRKKKDDADLRIATRKSESELDAQIESRVVMQWQAYANQLKIDNDAIRALVKECQDECRAEKEEMRREIQQAHEQRTETDRLYARVMGWMESMKTTLRRKGIEIPSWPDDPLPGSAAYPPLARQPGDPPDE